MRDLGARKPEKGVQWLRAGALRMNQRLHLPMTSALARVEEVLSAKVAAHARRKRLTVSGPVRVQTPASRVAGEARVMECRFLCDAGLGGLARWLRAAGWDAFWQADIEDSELIVEAQRSKGTILTTDSFMMERRLLRDRIVPAFWMPPTLFIPEQLDLVFREFSLRRREPRCMHCGGELARVDKEAVRDRIPPKTLLWLNEYFVCGRCGKLFW
ncbi:MAG TPA: Mut7-C RNAse domain-containing protein, partial [Verrucomicrobiae bacterium]|nr:Mut7-C RNAse domain-containing protein [Verrucomicrobiae bacterium]